MSNQVKINVINAVFFYRNQITLLLSFIYVQNVSFDKYRPRQNLSFRNLGLNYLSLHLIRASLPSLLRLLPLHLKPSSLSSLSSLTFTVWRLSSTPCIKLCIIFFINTITMIIIISIIVIAFPSYCSCTKEGLFLKSILAWQSWYRPSVSGIWTCDTFAFPSAKSMIIMLVLKVVREHLLVIMYLQLSHILYVMLLWSI